MWIAVSLIGRFGTISLFSFQFRRGGSLKFWYFSHSIRFASIHGSNWIENPHFFKFHCACSNSQFRQMKSVWWAKKQSSSEMRIRRERAILPRIESESHLKTPPIPSTYLEIGSMGSSTPNLKHVILPRHSNLRLIQDRERHESKKSLQLIFIPTSLLKIGNHAFFQSQIKHMIFVLKFKSSADLHFMRRICILYRFPFNWKGWRLHSMLFTYQIHFISIHNQTERNSIGCISRVSTTFFDWGPSIGWKDRALGILWNKPCIHYFPSGFQTANYWESSFGHCK